MTAALLTRAAPRPVTIRPAPRREPPFDDELDPSERTPSRFDRRLPFDTPTLPTVWRAGPPRPTGLPDVATWSRRFLIGLIETAGGRRPLHQLAGMVSPTVLRGLGTDFARASGDGRPHWLHRAAPRSIRVSEPAAGVAELCATVEAGPRVRALALRLEAQHGRWWCTRLQLG